MKPSGAIFVTPSPAWRTCKKTSKISKDNDRALSMLFEILSSFNETSDRLTAEDCYHFFGLSSQAHPQTTR